MVTCSLAGCEGPAESRGLCSRHYRQWKNGADYDAPLQRTQKGLYTTCTVESCERRHYAKGMCVYHYQRDWAGRPVEGSAFRTGENHPNSKLTAEKVRAIRRLHAQGWTTTALGREYGVHHSAVRKIIRWQTWRHVV